MELLMQLNANAFTEMSTQFKFREKEANAGITMIDFIEIMLYHLPENTKKNGDKEWKISVLIDLFKNIDVNDDELLEFDELTSYCVNSGVLAQSEHAKPQFQYKEKSDFVDTRAQGEAIAKMRWFSKPQKLVVFEQSSKIACVYNEMVHFLGEIRLEDRYEDKSSSRPQKLQNKVADDLGKGEDVFKVQVDYCMLDVEYVPTLKMLAISSSDLMLSFWDVETLRFQNETRSQVAQNMLRWCPTSASLATSGTDGVIHVWSITRDVKRQVKYLVRHTDTVTDILEVDVHEIIVSCSLDSKIILWDRIDFKPRGRLRGHKQGVRQMVFMTEHDILATVGFEYDCFLWDLSSRQLITTLASHRNSLIGIQVLQAKTQQLITADIDGIFKVWGYGGSGSTISSTSSMRVLETFCCNTKGGNVLVKAFATLDTAAYVAAGAKYIHLFERKRIRNNEDTPLMGFYNSTSSQLIAATNSGIVVYDATNGETVEEYQNIHETDLLMCCHDDSCKKLVAFTEQGVLAVFNCVNFDLVRQTSGEPLHPAAYLSYVTQDKVVVLCTTFGTIHVYDDKASNGTRLTLLRSIEPIEDACISCATFSFNLSLIATASASTNKIIFWDFQSLDEKCVCEDNASTILALEIIDPYPLLAAADTSGFITFWITPPHRRCGKYLCRMRHNISSQNEKDVGENEGIFVTNRPTQPTVSTVAVMKSTVDDATNSTYLFTGDEYGVVRCWNLSKMIERQFVAVTEDEKASWNHRSYNPRRKFVRRLKEDCQPASHDWNFAPSNENEISKHRASSAARVREQNSESIRKFENSLSQRPVTRETVSFVNWSNARKSTSLLVGKDAITGFHDDITELYGWSAHLDGVKNIEILSHPKALITSSYDYSFSIWTWKGEKLGSLLEKCTHYNTWKFGCDSANNAKARMEHVRQISEILKRREQSGEVTELSNMDSIDGARLSKLNPLLSRLASKKNRKETDFVPLVNEFTTVEHCGDPSSIRRASLHQLETPIRDKKHPAEDSHGVSDENFLKIERKSSVLAPEAADNSIDNIKAILDSTVTHVPGAKSKRIQEEGINKKLATLDHYTEEKNERDRGPRMFNSELDVKPSHFLQDKLQFDAEGNLLEKKSSKGKKFLARPKTVEGTRTPQSKDRYSSCMQLSPLKSGKQNAFVQSDKNVRHMEKSASSKSILQRDPSGRGFLARNSSSVKSLRSSSTLLNSSRSNLTIDMDPRKRERLRKERIQAKKVREIDKILGLAGDSTQVHSVRKSSRNLVRGSKKWEKMMEKIEKHAEEYENKLDEEDSNDLALKYRNQVRERRQHEKDLREKRMKKYLNQKQKNVTSNIGSALRRTSMLYHSSETNKNDRGKKNQQFGLYSVKEVMSVIRLFRSMDSDNSGSVECDELIESEMLSGLGIGDAASVFASMDADGSGDLSLDELLTVCFTYATKAQIQEMMQLSKLERIKETMSSKEEISPTQYRELQAIFRLYDKDNSGGVSVSEVLEMLLGTAEDSGKKNKCSLTAEEIQAFYAEYDMDGNDELDLDEFIVMLRDLYQTIPSA